MKQLNNDGVPEMLEGARAELRKAIGKIASLEVEKSDLIDILWRQMQRIEMLREALSGSVEQNLNCFYNHYGENPEGGNIPEYIQRAQLSLAVPAIDVEPYGGFE